MLNRRRSLLLTLILAFSITSCRQAERTSTETPPVEEVVSNTPPFKTKEPVRYRAVRTITQTDSNGRTTTIKTNIFKDGPSRREELEVPNTPLLVYLEKGGERFLLLPDEKIYAEVDSRFSLSESVDDNATESSPDRVLHTEAVQTKYQKLPAEVLEGKPVTKYKVTVNNASSESVSNNVTLFWIDENLGMPVKSEMSSADGFRTTMQLSAISFEVTQADFEIPTTYRRVSAPELIGRTKRAE